MIKAVIGLEFHSEMKSHTKVFSDSLNEFTRTPNKNVSVIDMAFPGILPTVNMECVKKSIMMSKILNCELPKYLEFDRKNYFYPDLPKGYQLTQFNHPIGINGKITIDVNGKEKEVLIHDIHLEEDSASLDHYSDYSTIDYNRCGVPLLELVTEPCFNNSEEAVCFLETIRNIYKYTDISEADSKKGQIRCDVNVSIMDENDIELGTKVEVKNVNSFSSVKKTIDYEIERQTNLLLSGHKDEIVQETRRFDEETNTTIHMRSKSDAIDYKYFTEPNIPRFILNDKLVSEVISLIPELPNERKEKYITKYGLSEYDANVLIKDKDISDYFESCTKECSNYKSLCNYITTRLIGELNKREININECFIKPEYLVKLVNLVDNDTISTDQAKKIFTLMLDEELTIEELIEKYDMHKMDSNLIDGFIDEVISENEKAITDYKNGRTNMLDYMVGQVMKKSKGKANPAEAKAKLLERIS